VAEAGNGNRGYLKVGDVIRLRLPYSEICVRWGVAGKPLKVQLIGEGAAELLHDDGSPFPLPVTHSEAGIYLDDADRYYVPTRAIAPSQLGLEGA